ncbi:MAG: hypothetical protein WDA22_01710 [Bacteroidota bacterium]
MLKHETTPKVSAVYHRDLILNNLKLTKSTLSNLLLLLEYNKKELIFATKIYDESLRKYQKYLKRKNTKARKMLLAFSSIKMHMYNDKQIIFRHNIQQIQKAITKIEYSETNKTSKEFKPIEWDDTLVALAAYLIAGVNKRIFKQGNEQAKNYALQKFSYKGKGINRGSLSTYMKRFAKNELSDTTAQIKGKLMMK